MFLRVQRYVQLNTQFYWHGYAGLFIILVSEILMFEDIEPVSTFFTPIVWTGYIMFADAIIYKIKGSSLLVDRAKEFVIMIPLSIFIWLIFEWYNLFLRNWVYVGLPDSDAIRFFGYAWSFATILPGIFQTTELLEAVLPFNKLRCVPWKLNKTILSLRMVVGAVFCIFPLFMPDYAQPFLFIFVWIGFVFLVDPINYLFNRQSLLGDLEKGLPGRFWSLMAAGYVCGVLWEFWNYWANGKWVYTVPILSNIKIFEMPVFGFLGFGPFALECYILYIFIRGRFSD